MKIDLLVGSTLGGTEYVAEELAQKLEDHQVTLHLDSQLSDLDPSAFWLVCTSTHGAGDVPDNLAPIYEQLLSEQPNLAGTHYAVAAIGSSSYDTFCGAGHAFDKQLQALGATALVELIEIDVEQEALPEDTASKWLDQWKQKLHDLNCG